MGADLVTTAEAANRLGLARQVVARQIQRHGLILDENGRFDYDTLVAARRNSAHVAASRTGGAGPEASAALKANAELKRLQAQRMELRLAQERGELVRKADVVAALANAGQRIRDAFRNLPARAAQEIAGTIDPVEIRRVLARHVDETLDAYASGLEELAFGGRGDLDDDAEPA